MWNNEVLNIFVSITIVRCTELNEICDTVSHLFSPIVYVSQINEMIHLNEYNTTVYCLRCDKYNLNAKKKCLDNIHSVKKVSGMDDLFMVPNSNFCYFCSC